MFYRIIKGQYNSGKIDAARVWAYADEKKITEAEALSICGPRPIVKE